MLGKTLAAVIVLFQGTDSEFDSVPIPHINLKSVFVSAQIVVGLIPTMVECVSLLLGNDLADDKVIMNPIVYENELENTDVFPACAITTAMGIKLEKEETLLQDGSTETSDFEIKHIFCT